MNEDLKKFMSMEIRAAVKETVNGKIDEVHAALTAHAKKDEENMDEIRPFIQGIASFRILYRIIMGLGGIAIAYLAVKNAFHL